MTPTVESNIITAYTAIHKLGVVHGDVRPENVLILKDESVRIIDFENGLVVAENGLKEMETEKEEVNIMLRELKYKFSCNGHS